MRLSAIFLVLTTAVSTASAQSLADVARQEGERRQTVKDAGKTYTNQDLKPVAPPPAAPDADATAAGEKDKAAAATDTGAAKDEKATKADAKTGKNAEESETKDQAYWSKRIADLRDQLERDQTFLDALQTRIDALTTDFVNRDDPAQRSQIAGDRQKALAELDRMRKQVEADKRAIPDLEEEARRAGVPAGWLR